MHKKRSKQLRFVLVSVLSAAFLAPTVEGPSQQVSATSKSVTALAAIRSDISDSNSVYVGGQSIGIKLNSRGVLIVGFQRLHDTKSPGEKAHLQVGDMIEQVGDNRVDSIADLKSWMGQHPHVRTLPLVVKRGEQHLRFHVPLVLDDTGHSHLGLFVRDRTSGVGTLTFYDGIHHRYGALGHIITDADTGQPVDGSGKVYDSEVFGVIKGTSGKPGEKRGRFVQPDVSIGSIDTNSDFGVFGNMSQRPPHSAVQSLMPIAAPKQVHDGDATLWTVVEGQKVERFRVSIENVVRQTRPTTKSMIVHVIDKRLLQETGGIVQGMSGSPIVQDGRLIGAVTHVFVSDPTRGYGVYAQWMLQESEHRERGAVRGAHLEVPAWRHRIPAWLRKSEEALHLG